MSQPRFVTPGSTSEQTIDEDASSLLTRVRGDTDPYEYRFSGILKLPLYKDAIVTEVPVQSRSLQRRSSSSSSSSTTLKAPRNTEPRVGVLMTHPYSQLDLLDANTTKRSVKVVWVSSRHKSSLSAQHQSRRKNKVSSANTNPLPDFENNGDDSSSVLLGELPVSKVQLDQLDPSFSNTEKAVCERVQHVVADALRLNGVPLSHNRNLKFLRSLPAHVVLDGELVSVKATSRSLALELHGALEPFVTHSTGVTLASEQTDHMVSTFFADKSEDADDTPPVANRRRQEDAMSTKTAEEEHHQRADVVTEPRVT